MRKKPPTQKQLVQYQEWLAFCGGGGGRFEARTSPSSYDFAAEHELVEMCQHGEMIHMDAEPRRPPEIDYAD